MGRIITTLASEVHLFQHQEQWLTSLIQPKRKQWSIRGNLEFLRIALIPPKMLGENGSKNFSQSSNEVTRDWILHPGLTCYINQVNFGFLRKLLFKKITVQYDVMKPAKACPTIPLTFPQCLHYYFFVTASCKAWLARQLELRTILHYLREHHFSSFFSNCREREMCNISITSQKPQDCTGNVLFVQLLSSTANRHQEPAIVFIFTC